MTWRDDLLPASFRGVKFLYSSTRREGGRHKVNHEFPLRDANYLEDLGKRAKTHRIAAYVLGAGYMQTRDQLETALDQSGNAVLVHPYKGNLTVGVESYSVEESPEFGGSARFDIVFIEAGTQPSPTSHSSTASAAYGAGANQFGTLSGNFLTGYLLNGLPGFILNALQTVIGILITGLDVLAQNPLLTPGAMAAPIGAIAAAASSPEVLGPAVTACFQAYAAQIVAAIPVGPSTGSAGSAANSADPTLSSRGPDPVIDPTYGLAAFATWGATLPPVIGTTPQRLQQAACQDALVMLVQGAAVTAMVQLFAGSSFPSAADAESARTQVSDLIDAQAVVAGDQGDDTAYGGWMALYGAATNDLTVRAQRLPDLLAYQFADTLPSLAVAQRIYQDASRAPELVSRNAAPHPLFMPRDIEAIAA